MTDAELEEFLKQEFKQATKSAIRSDIDFICGLHARTAINRLREQGLLE